MPYKDIEKRNAHYRQRWDGFNAEQRKKHHAYRQTPLYRRREHLKGRYGLTLEQWNAMFETQGRCCAICKAETSGWSRGWHTDHDHQTKKVRAILCHACNRLLGHVKDDVSRLRAFIEYLEQAGGLSLALPAAPSPSPPCAGSEPCRPAS